jgi:hypothetical protein
MLLLRDEEDDEEDEVGGGRGAADFTPTSMLVCTPDANQLAADPFVPFVVFLSLRMNVTAQIINTQTQLLLLLPVNDEKVNW